MRIGIDARMAGLNNRGIGRYIVELLRHLLIIDDTNKYVIFLRSDNWDVITIPEHKTGAWVKVHADIPWYGAKEQWYLTKILRQANVDVMHFPHWNIPLGYRDPFVLTVHDLIMFHYPRAAASTRGPFVYWTKHAAARMIAASAIRRAEHVLVTSEWTKADVAKHMHVPLSKMTTTYQAPTVLRPYGGENVLAAWGSQKPFVLYVGAAYPHKNLHRLLLAWQQVNRRLAGNYTLVFVGRKDRWYTDLVTSSLWRETPNIRHIGFVQDHELALLYARARLFVFPSLYEGFGLPPLEAMAQGTPVVSSSASCLPEVLGEAAFYVDPMNTDHIAEALFRVLSDEQLRRTLRDAGLREAGRYSWRRLAQQTRRVYENYASKTGH